jgi:hypothetical protein
MKINGFFGSIVKLRLGLGLKTYLFIYNYAATRPPNSDIAFGERDFNF